MAKKYFLPFLFLTGIILSTSSCNLLNLRNIGNENKWKNKVLEPALVVHYDFNPLVIKAYDDESYFLAAQIEDTSALPRLDSILRGKLTQRNFILSDAPEFSLLTVDSLFLNEYTEEVPVYNDEGDYLTDAKYYDVRILVHGYLTLDGQSKIVMASYDFESSPRPGLIIQSLTVHSNSALNMEKVMAILMNRFSYEAYKAARDLRKHPIHDRDSLR